VIEPQSVVLPSQAPRNPAEWIPVSYNGSVSNHFIASPTRKVRYYQFGKKGDVFPAHIDDVMSRPDKFIPLSIGDAKRIWPQYPVGVPDSIVEKLGLPPELEEPVYVAIVDDGEGLPFSEPFEEIYEADASQPMPPDVVVVSKKKKAKTPRG
jgi:hypothetical protein